jgi:ribonuclease P protein component
VTARIRRSAQFRAFAGAPRRRRGPLSIVAAPSVQPGVARVGFAIGRGVGNAVERNRLRRRLRSAMSQLSSRLDRDAAYLLGATRGAKDLTYGEIVALLGELVPARAAA